MSEFDYLFKLLIIGSSAAGKSSILSRFVDGTWTHKHISTLGVDFKVHNTTIDDKLVKLQIWDTAGQERFHSLTSAFVHGASGILLVYDITSHDSFADCKKLIESIRNDADPDVELLLVGNKCDLEADRQVSFEMAEEFARTYGLPQPIETSAKDNINIDAAFANIATRLKEKFELNQPEVEDDHILMPDLTPDDDIGGTCVC
ncbi:hypothetical protein PCE1_001951 [Barthelona sp. PCE]